MVARLDPIKDHATLIRAFGLVHERWPRAELHLAGDGPLRGSLESLARELGVGQAVHFLGSISTVPSFLDSLDIFCFLTTEQEGMGNALAEALAHGLPCVVSDLPVMREVAGEPPACAALLTSPQPGRVAEAIDDLLRDVEARRWLSDAARQRAGSVFSPRRVVDRYWACLQGPS
jgi:glycosyltransferase involved in cell wall biosynthesis